MLNFSSTEDLMSFLRTNVVFTGEAAEILGISTARVRKLISDGKLEVIKSEGSGHLLYRPHLEIKKIELEESRKKYRPFDS